MGVTKEAETIRLYREEEVVELIVKYLLENKKQEQDKSRNQKVRQIVSRQRKRRILREWLISFLKQIITILFCLLGPWLFCKVFGDTEYYNLYILFAPIGIYLLWQLIKGRWER